LATLDDVAQIANGHICLVSIHILLKVASLASLVLLVLLVTAAKLLAVKQVHLFTQPTCLVGPLTLSACLACAHGPHVLWKWIF
jgi:hypothetical protein